MACKINIFLEKSCISFEVAEKWQVKEKRESRRSFDLHRKSTKNAANCQENYKYALFNGRRAQVRQIENSFRRLRKKRWKFAAFHGKVNKLQMNDRKEGLFLKNICPIWIWRLACGLWLLLIFSQSAMPAPVSQAESGGLFYLLVQIFPFLTEHLLRKLAHFTEFAILGIFLGKSLRASTTDVLLAGLLCALCDETIQLFVMGRSSQVSDVWVDFSGILAAAGLLWLLDQFWSGRCSRGNADDKSLQNKHKEK